MEFGFVSSVKDSFIFIYLHDDNIIIIRLYVDDIAITGNSSVTLIKPLKELNFKLRIKDFGKLYYFVGIQANIFMITVCFSLKSNILLIFSQLHAWKIVHRSQFLYHCNWTMFRIKISLSRILITSEFWLESYNTSH